VTTNEIIERGLRRLALKAAAEHAPCVLVRGCIQTRGHRGFCTVMNYESWRDFAGKPVVVKVIE
jgi:hypothetical protein